MSEHQIVEYKSIWKDEWLEWVCGFANAQGGVLYVGMDNDGNPVGLKNPKKLLEDIPNKIRQTMGLVCDVSLHAEDPKRPYISVVVPAYSLPVAYRGSYYRRSGATNQLLTGHEITRFLTERLNISWEDAVVENIGPADFRHDSFEMFKQGALKSGRMAPEDFECSDWEMLDKLELLVDGKATRAAVLLFCDNPRKWLPFCHTKIAFFTDEANILYQDEVYGSLFAQAEKVVDLLFSKYMVAPISYEGFRRIDNYPFPREAVREMVYNALVHSDYSQSTPIQIRVFSDKLRISNAAMPPQEMTEKTLLATHRSYPLNKKIAQAFYRAGYIEAWGRGVQKIRESCDQMGIPMAHFTVLPQTMTVELQANARSAEALQVALSDIIPPSTPPVPPQLTPPVDPPSTHIVELLRLLSSGKAEAPSQMMVELGLSDRRHFRNAYLYPALNAGYVERTIPDKPTSRKQKYRLTDLGEKYLKGGMQNDRA